MNRFTRINIAMLHLVTILPMWGCREEVERETCEEVAREAYERGVLFAMEQRRKLAEIVEDTKVHPTWNWSGVEFGQFCLHLTHDELNSLRKSLGIREVPMDYSSEKNIREIQKQVLWVSSNIFAYPFRDEEKINYHELTRWTARKIGVDSWLVDTQPTLILERAICEKLWVDTWDKLNEDQRKELLTQIDTENTLDKLALANLGGAAALSILSGTVYFSGFAFYATMSTTISLVAGWFGITLPFSVYTGVSSLVAFLSGPVGWAIITINVAVSTALLGKANAQKTAAFIVQTHSLKVAKLIEAGATVPDVPKSPG